MLMQDGRKILESGGQEDKEERTKGGRLRRENYKESRVCSFCLLTRKMQRELEEAREG